MEKLMKVVEYRLNNCNSSISLLKQRNDDYKNIVSMFNWVKTQQENFNEDISLSKEEMKDENTRQEWIKFTQTEEYNKMFNDKEINTKIILTKRYECEIRIKNIEKKIYDTILNKNMSVMDKNIKKTIYKHLLNQYDEEVTLSFDLINDLVQIEFLNEQEYINECNLSRDCREDIYKLCCMSYGEKL